MLFRSRKRLALLKSGLPRAVVRFTNAKVTVQITNFEGKGDNILASASSAAVVLARERDGVS